MEFKSYWEFYYVDLIWSMALKKKKTLNQLISELE